MSIGLTQRRRESAGQAGGGGRFGMHDSTGLRRMVVISYSELIIFFNFMRDRKDQLVYNKEEGLVEEWTHLAK